MKRLRDATRAFVKIMRGQPAGLVLIHNGHFERMVLRGSVCVAGLESTDEFVFDTLDYEGDAPYFVRVWDNEAQARSATA